MGKHISSDNHDSEIVLQFTEVTRNMDPSEVRRIIEETNLDTLPPGEMKKARILELNAEAEKRGIKL